jgi:hypothetical protein
MTCYNRGLPSFFLVCALLSGLALSSKASASLASSGDLAFVGFNADVADAFSVVTLVDIDANSTVYFSDKNWNGSVFTGSEGLATWTSGGSTISAGTVILFSNVNGSASVNLGSVSKSGSFDLSGSEDQLFAYLDASANQTPDTFLAAISNKGFASQSTLTGTGLTAGSTAVSFTGSPDIMEYTGLRTGQGSFSGYLALIGNTSNWATQDGTGDQSNDGTGPDIPFNTSAFSVSGVPEPASAFCWGALAFLGIAIGKRRSANKIR